MLQETDDELIRLLQQDDEAAFARLYDRYAPSLIGFAAERLPCWEEARDLIHDLFVYFWEERLSITITVSIRSFLFAAVRYRIVDRYRKQATQKKYKDHLAKLGAVTVTAEDVLCVKELEGQLYAAVRELTPRLQEIFRLSRFEHLRSAEIAQRLGLSEQTVKNQLTTALHQLKAKLSSLVFLFW